MPTVLVVEDEGIIAADICATLRMLGHEVPAAVDNAEDAVRLAESLRPSLVLMDVHLRDESDGIQAAHVVRDRLGIPVVYLTSHADQTTRARAMGAQPYGYLLKPFSDRELAVAIDVALQRHELESKLKGTTALLQAVIDSMEEEVIATDLDGNVLVANHAAKRMAGDSDAPPSAVRPDRDHFLPNETTPCESDRLPLARALQGETLRQLELYVRKHDSKDGRWHSVNAAPLRDARGTVRGGVAVSRDVTEMKSLQLELQHLSLVDELTGLHNRRAFMTLAEHQLKIAARTRRFAALLFVDLDGFKAINDTFGHKMGDLGLQAAAGVLRESFRASDVVARLGGDEFVVLAIEVDAASVEVMRDRVYRNVDAFNAKRLAPYRLSMSVGICVCDPTRGESLADLAVRADAQMYEEKARRRATRAP